MNTLTAQQIIDNLSKNSVLSAYEVIYKERLVKMDNPKKYLETQQKRLLENVASFSSDPFSNIKTQLELSVVNQLLFDIELGI
jgi:hypothetical protein